MRALAVLLLALATRAAAQAAPPEALDLSLHEAISRALDTNLAVLTAQGALQAEQGRRKQELSDLLPIVNTDFSASRQVISLDAFGFPVPAGQSPLLGPFPVVDARLSLSQRLLDVAELRESRAAARDVRAAQLQVRDARDLVVLAAANAYLECLAAGARVDAAQAEVDLAAALERQATDMKAAGTVAGLDVLRSQVQLESARQRLLVAQNDSARSRLALAHVAGIPLSTTLHLVDSMPYAPIERIDLDGALATARLSRPDLLRAQVMVSAEEERHRAAQARRLPTLHLAADTGMVGPDTGDLENTWRVGAVVGVPIFNGRTGGEVLESAGDLARLRAEAKDLETTVELDVRVGFLDLTSAQQRLELARRGRDLAQRQLEQARDRFAAGVDGGLATAQAQEDLARSDAEWVESLRLFNVAKAKLAFAMGVAEQAARMLESPRETPHVGNSNG